MTWKLMMGGFTGGSIAGVKADAGGRICVIVLLMNFTVGYALKYAASPPKHSEWLKMKIKRGADFFVCVLKLTGNNQQSKCIDKNLK